MIIVLNIGLLFIISLFILFKYIFDNLKKIKKQITDINVKKILEQDSTSYVCCEKKDNYQKKIKNIREKIEKKINEYNKLSGKSEDSDLKQISCLEYGFDTDPLNNGLNINKDVVFKKKNIYGKNNNLIIDKNLDINGRLVASNLNSEFKNNFFNSSLPKGSIIIWGSKEAIPDGWVICDGGRYYTNHRGEIKKITIKVKDSFKVPDLRNLFVYGYNGSNLGVTDGEKEVRLTQYNMPMHQHEYIDTTGAGEDVYSGGYHELRTKTSISEPYKSEMDVEPINNMPPYFKLIYIYKIK